MNRDFSTDYKNAARRGKEYDDGSPDEGVEVEEEYDYENANDASFCPAEDDVFDVQEGPGKDDDQGEIFEFAAAGHAGAYVGDNLVEAPLTVSIF